MKNFKVTVVVSLKYHNSRPSTDWYNNEHVPLRMNHLSSFLTGARYFSENSKPSWVAVYDIDDVATFSDPSYTRLRVNRSPREADLVKRLELLDRRTCQILGDSGESASSSSYHPRNPSPFIATFGVNSLDKNVLKVIATDRERWEKVDGWLRTRVYEVIDNLRSGLGVSPGEEAQKIPKYMVVIGEWYIKLALHSVY